MGGTLHPWPCPGSRGSTLAASRCTSAASWTATAAGPSAAACPAPKAIEPEMPDPDLVVRTSGEYRISNFLLWELAYSELVFTDVLWPDFRREHLFEAVREFQQRERRFGAIETGE